MVFFPLVFVQALYFYSFPGNNKYFPGASNILLTIDTLCDLVPFAHLKKRENTHGGVLLLGKLQAILKVTLLNGCFSRFKNCTNGNKLHKASHIFVIYNASEEKSKIERWWQGYLRTS